ncbi:tripartite tricarboxylate transporter substrate binding protein [Polaromonas sp. P1(28)-13]|nr:tripartite tricarboxylate transporter substrate binding protein [Polaromonas sp. P1(28)-13]
MQHLNSSGGKGGRIESPVSPCFSPACAARQTIEADGQCAARRPSSRVGRMIQPVNEPPADSLERKSPGAWVRQMIGQGVNKAVCSFVLACAVLSPADAADAPQFPSRPIKILIGYGPGGTTDTLARFYAVKLGEILNTPIIIDNKPGASELLAALPVMNSAADGYTLWMGTGGALVQNPGIRKDLPYDILKNFTPIALVGEAEAVMLVKPDLPVNTLSELIAYGKANPGKLNYGSGGVGSGNHLWMEYLIGATGARFTHIPYKSDVEITRDIMAGNVDMTMVTALIALPLLKEGKVKAIAVTGSQRLKSLPNVPSFSESGIPEIKSKDSYTFFALMGPAGMPTTVVKKLNEAINKVSMQPDVDQRVRETMQIRPKTITSNEYGQVLKQEVDKWRELGKTIKIDTL